jgi:hypothetical protein
MMFRYLFARLACRKLFFGNVQIQLIDQAIKMITNDLDILVIMERL